MNIMPIGAIRPINNINMSSAIELLTPLSSKINQANNVDGNNNLAVGNIENSESVSYSFADLLKNLIDQTNATDSVTKTDAFNLSLGQTSEEDLHNIEINAVKADLALRTMVSVRNKVMDAYTEIMRITI